MKKASISKGGSSMQALEHTVKLIPLRRSILLGIAILVLISPLASAQVPWKTTSSPAVSKVAEDGSEWTIVQEARQYEFINGMQVKESRKTTTKVIGKTVMFEEIDTRTIEKWVAFSSDRRVIEKFYPGSKVVTLVEKTIIENLPEWVKKSFERIENGILLASSATFYYFSPRSDGAIAEDTSITYDSGDPMELSVYKYFPNGTAQIEKYEWDKSANAWGFVTKSELVAPKAAGIIAPKKSSDGYSIGGSVVVDGILPTSVRVVVAESNKGVKVEAVTDGLGRWIIPGSLLGEGTWEIRAIMPDGSKGEPALLQVIGEEKTFLAPIIQRLPKLRFAGSDILVEGSGLVTKGEDILPTVWFSNDLDSVSIYPKAFSDKEFISDTPSHILMGDTMVMVNNGTELSNALKTDLFGFEIIFPVVTQVGQIFTAMVKLTGLTGEFMEHEFTAVISISGPIRFADYDGNSVVVSLKQGVALVRIEITGLGEMAIFGRLQSMPAY